MTGGIAMSDDEAIGLGGKIDFLTHFSDLPDPRQALKVLYPLDEVLLLTLCAVLCGADGWVSVALFGKTKLDFLRRFLPFANGVPSHDQLGLIFGALDAAAFQTCFIAWAQALSGGVEGVVAVDGKTLRRSFDRAGNKGALHMISAFSSAQKLVLGARAVKEKSNEITAIPELLDLLAIKGAIVTIDAMGCQKKIADKIIAKKADYVLGLKGNQGSLRDDVELLFEEQMAKDFKDIVVSRAAQTDAGHGRIESREVIVTADVAWLRKRHGWQGLNTIVMVLSTRETPKGVERERRFYISSLPADAEKLAAAIRAHWGIENSLHWVLDVNFRDDDCRIRKKNAPANFTAIKRVTVNALKKAPAKASIKSKRLMAGWDNDFLETTLLCL
jgi:predicted transposase YbfD/YdcC